MVKTCVRLAVICAFLAALMLPASTAAQSIQSDEPAANPGRPTVSNPATLAPVGYIQFETGMLGANDSPGVSTLYGLNQVTKLAVAPRLQFSVASGPIVHSTAGGITANSTDAVSLEGQVILFPGQGVKPTLAAGYSHSVYAGDSPDLDIGGSRNSVVLYASADVKGFHYDANFVFNEVIDEGPDAHRLQFGQTLSISHPIGKGFAVSGEIWRFTQPFLRGNAIGNLWAISYTARKNLVFDAGFDKGLTSTSTHWEAFAGFTYLLPKKLWGK